ncbi:gliding motility-associated C-terminal domain-containing protein [Formosa sp. Hel1_31_208]|uniref:T9SS type B sorting domain-containing protein n=1 Tax=Formosa sp. Hel1_31_208 TaxID=1798225 RepID=UPI00087D39C4|nr:choice-of-anchor L domain-containing protein [Formosa sp. Hel1_31_208]SDS59970.1 gliding motility-associated C-terminal domain-containing protein [Formosa sp. Hel1_31_208]
MKFTLFVFCFLFTVMTFGQNISVDSASFTAQQLIEDILIDSDCIDNVIVTNVVGGDFGNTEQSFGFFDAAGTNFPFESGIVLSTGRLSNVPGPNTSLSDDDAADWQGDADLEFVLNESNTTNATILEFDFTSVANEISFRYIFASEEYQEGNPNTCQFSDLFGFLIRPINNQQYANIALVPGTQTPVKVTTVHPDIPGGCPAENEAYFESFNGANTPINFNGQTTVLTATATVVPNETYHVKLVIADEQNYRFDSAVFLEAGSFRLSTDIGPDRLVQSGTAVCGNNTITIQTDEPGATNTYKWFIDGVELMGETNASLDVSEGGFYSVEVTRDNCVLFGEVTIEYADNPIVFDALLTECDQDQDALTFYDLDDIEPIVTNANNSIGISGFFLSENEANQNSNPITNPNNFENTIPFQTVYARVINQAGCYSIAEIQLEISNNTLIIPSLDACDGEIADGFTEFNLNDITTSISSQIPTNANVSFYETEEDAFLEVNILSGIFQNTIPFNQTIYVKVESNNQCYSISTAELEVLYTPVLMEDETFIYCLNDFPEMITLTGGILNDLPNNYYYEWLFNGALTEVNTTFNDINEPGTYTVIVTDPNGCSASRTITVLASNIATIENIYVTEGLNNNTVSVEVSGEGDYEFALDDLNGEFQGDSVFTNVEPGFHTVFVRDINGCGLTEQTISVLGFPKFFTPNGDPYNERWQVYGVNADFNRSMEVKIFNRYGKFITQFDNTSVGWDGTLNGQALPSDDYWFVVRLIDGRTYTGHFALKR